MTGVVILWESFYFVSPANAIFSMLRQFIVGISGMMPVGYIQLEMFSLNFHKEDNYSVFFLYNCKIDITQNMGCNKRHRSLKLNR